MTPSPPGPQGLRLGPGLQPKDLGDLELNQKASAFSSPPCHLLPTPPFCDWQESRTWARLSNKLMTNAHLNPTPPDSSASSLCPFHTASSARFTSGKSRKTPGFPSIHSANTYQAGPMPSIVPSSGAAVRTRIGRCLQGARRLDQAEQVMQGLVGHTGDFGRPMES